MPDEPPLTPCMRNKPLNRDKQLAASAQQLHSLEDRLREGQQRQQADAARLAERDTQIVSLREQALNLENECAPCTLSSLITDLNYLCILAKPALSETLQDHKATSPRSALASALRSMPRCWPVMPVIAPDGGASSCIGALRRSDRVLEHSPWNSQRPAGGGTSRRRRRR